MREQGATLAAAKGVRSRTVLAAESVPFEGDPDFLERLFLILIDNVVKFIPPQGEIVVSSQLAGDAVIVAVCDTGIGIHDADLPPCSRGSTGWTRLAPASPAEQGSGSPSVVGLLEHTAVRSRSKVLPAGAPCFGFDYPWIRLGGRPRR